jgi:crotonobetainyl-CoA:carnitine CoA-transferase CaiB-like acyl-CoA transferase
LRAAARSRRIRHCRNGRYRPGAARFGWRPAARPLHGLTVLDLTEYICGPYATKLLADFGADVIKVERPGGDPARQLGPFPNGECHPEKSGTFFYFNTNKRSIELDLASAAGATFSISSTGPAVVETWAGNLDGLGIGWDAIHARRPTCRRFHLELGWTVRTGTTSATN